MLRFTPRYVYMLRLRACADIAAAFAADALPCCHAAVFAMPLIDALLTTYHY